MLPTTRTTRSGTCLCSQKITAVTDAEGNYALELPIPADLGLPTLDIYMEASAPAASGGTAVMQSVSLI